MKRDDHPSTRVNRTLSVSLLHYRRSIALIKCVTPTHHLSPLDVMNLLRTIPVSRNVPPREAAIVQSIHHVSNLQENVTVVQVQYQVKRTSELRLVKLRYRNVRAVTIPVLVAAKINDSRDYHHTRCAVMQPRHGDDHVRMRRCKRRSIAFFMPTMK